MERLCSWGKAIQGSIYAGRSSTSPYGRKTTSLHGKYHLSSMPELIAQCDLFWITPILCRIGWVLSKTEKFHFEKTLILFCCCNSYKILFCFTLFFQFYSTVQCFAGNWIPLEHACNFRAFFLKRSTILVYICNEMRRDSILFLNFPPNKPNDLPQQCSINQDKKNLSV